MAPTIRDATFDPPPDGAGVPTGEGDWRFTVAILIAAGGARVGVSRVGVARVSDPDWYDITGSVVAAEWTRGASVSGSVPPHPNVGTASLVLDNTRDPGAFTPWIPHTLTATGFDTEILHREYRPGALIRITMHEPGATTTIGDEGSYGGFLPGLYVTRDGWFPLFTGIVEDWVETIELGRSLITVALTEPGALLAAVDDEPVAAQGSGELAAQRLERLLDAAAYPFAIVFGDATSDLGATITVAPNFQATTLSGNRWQEVLNVGDTAYGQPVFTLGDGNLNIGQQDKYELANLFVNAGVAGSWVHPDTALPSPIAMLTWDLAAEPSADGDRFPSGIRAEYPAPLVISSNTDFIVNSVTTGRVGDASRHSYRDYSSVGAYGLRTAQITDLMLDTDTELPAIAQDIVQQYSGWNTGAGLSDTTDQALQPGAVRLHSQPGATASAVAQRLIDLFSATVLDYGNPGDTSPAIRFLGRTMQMHHTIRPIGDDAGIVWDSTYTVFSLANYTPEP